MENKNILIAVPTFEHIQNETFKSIYGLEKPANCNIYFDYINGYDCARARNAIVHEALNYNFDYVFMIDSDIVLPRHALISLLSKNKDIILGWYLRKRTTTGQTEIFSIDNYDFTDTNNINIKDISNKTEIFEIKGGGLGISLIKIDVFKKMRTDTWFKYIEYNKTDVLSEDNYFCSEAYKEGFKIWVDPLVRGGHISKIII